MSEFQHYEFHVIDRPLDDKAMEFLRSRSTRAEITRYSFVNEYQWGDLKGDPLDWVKRFFDVYFYYANWGTHDLMLRVPRNLCDLDTAEQYVGQDCMELIKTKEHIIFSFSANVDGPDWDEVVAELAPLLSVRNELMAGDYRALYLGWLAAVASGFVEDDVQGPPLPPGMGKLTAAQRALADFLWIDEDLLEIATANASGEAPTGPTTEMLAAWVETMPAAEKNAILVRCLRGEGAAVGQELLLRYHAEKKRSGSPTAAAPDNRRTAGELLAAREERAKQRQRAEAEKRAAQQARREREQATARARHLDQLAKRQPRAWEEVETLIATKQPKHYDEAVTLLKDLRDVAQRAHEEDGFATQLRKVVDRHKGKPSFMERLRKAGLRAKE